MASRCVCRNSFSCAKLTRTYEQVVIYDSDDKVGGIWARVNSTSQLQLNSVLYRFHPSVRWSKGFPQRDEIVGQIKRLVDKYNLQGSLRLKVCLSGPALLGDDTDLA